MFKHHSLLPSCICRGYNTSPTAGRPREGSASSTITTAIAALGRATLCQSAIVGMTARAYQLDRPWREKTKQEGTLAEARVA